MLVKADLNHVDQLHHIGCQLAVLRRSALSKREIESAGTTIRHAITTIMRSKKWQRS